MASKYDRIADDLRRKIHARELTPGARLPAETALMEQYKVSLPTMRQALAVLRAEGLIESRHGHGTYVREPRQRVRRTNERYQWEKDRAQASEDERRKTGATEHDTGLTVDDLEFFATYDDSETADERIAEIFKVAPGTRLLRRTYQTRLRRENVPLSTVDSYLLYDVVRLNPALLDENNEPWPGGTQNQLSTIGIELDRIVDEITARPPQGDEAEQLDVPPGVSLIVLRKISIDTEDRVVELSEILMPGDRYELRYTTPLARWS
ncbi:GntR family transcriptional regulator [Micromonospora sp. NPDC005203]|uniref:GntR family transcriptional regulator n=1 Tax=Micromonospora sp. NPDC005203 TaxID=3364226 RepID=UPI0036B0B123